jgi:hypothetical protein
MNVYTKSFRARDLVSFFVAFFAIFVAAVVVILIEDPYGRLGLRSSAQVPNLPERTLMVSRARDQAFDSAIVGNSTSIPMRPEILDLLTGLHFVSLSMSGSQAPAALAAARFFINHHQHVNTIIVALDDSWCTSARDNVEAHSFPWWLYGNDLDYIVGLFRNVSFSMLNEAFAERGGGARLDGYHPYDAVFQEHGFMNLDTVLARLNRAKRPVQARYPEGFVFVPPTQLKELLNDHPTIHFVVYWTPRYLTIIPVPGSPADAEDKRCKLQVAIIAREARNATLVDWSGDRPENRDPRNFYETNHYRDRLAEIIMNDIATKLAVKEE